MIKYYYINADTFLCEVWWCWCIKCVLFQQTLVFARFHTLILAYHSIYHFNYLDDHDLEICHFVFILIF